MMRGKLLHLFKVEKIITLLYRINHVLQSLKIYLYKFSLVEYSQGPFESSRMNTHLQVKE